MGTFTVKRVLNPTGASQIYEYRGVSPADDSSQLTLTDEEIEASVNLFVDLMREGKAHTADNESLLLTDKSI